MFEPRQKGGGKNILKLQDGEKVTGVFSGKAHKYYQHWVGNRGVKCTRAQGTCGPCANNDKGSFRFRVNFLMIEEGKWVAKVFEQGATVYDMLSDLAQEVSLETHKVTITRKGSGKNDTTYSILPVMKGGELTKEELVAAAAVDLNNLSDAQEEDDAA